MKKSYIVRIVLWLLWTIWTAGYIYPNFFHGALKYIIQKIGEWIMQNPDAVMLILWGIFTIGLLAELALHFGKDSDPLKKIKLKYVEEKDKTESY